MLSLFSYSFIQNAFLASFFVSVVAAVVGYFILARGLTFAGHAFSHVGFAGAAGAVLAGVNPLWGLLSFTLIAALAIGALGRQLKERDTTIGIIFTLALSFGVLFLFLYKGYAEQAYSILFGTILGISTKSVITTAVFSLVCLILLTVCYRPLLFSSFDPQLAEARAVPTRLLSVLFLLIVAVTVSISVQVVGVLLIFTLMIGPAATAMRLTSSPFGAISLAIILALFYSFMGIILAAATNWPVSFFIASLSFAFYLPVRILNPIPGQNLL